MSTESVFIVPDMTCGHCEKALRGAFDKAVPGVQINIDLGQHRLSAPVDSKLARQIIVGAGYTARSAA
ncbi:heavy-metal-associated domain-containing protein [Paracoccus sp. (in: a-proteobacteria)]|uniref:heavy-metal-associated domain-containing protein n=1 Tax=Paracoccus sp. TaxID=267 RepID=UPI003A8B02AF